MKLHTVYLAILSFGLCLRLVKAIDLMGLSLWEPPRELFDLSDVFHQTEGLSGMIRRHQEYIDSIRHSYFRGAASLWSSPGRTQMVNDENHFEVSLDITGMNSSDLAIQFDESTRLLTISGQQTNKDNGFGYFSNSQFTRSFSVDPFVQADQMTATVEKDRLTVSAPKDIHRLHHSVRSIPVVDTNNVLTLPKVDTTWDRKESELSSNDRMSSAGDLNPLHTIEKRLSQGMLHLPQLKDEDVSQEIIDPNKHPIENQLEKDRMKAYKTDELRRRR